MQRKYDYEVIEFNGHNYRRATNHPKFSMNNYYRGSGGAPYRYLHHAIYTHHYGAVPPGYQVHHKDHNSLNNSPENLEALSPQEHAERHHEEQVARGHANGHNLDKARESAKVWHSSPEGLEWHKQHGEAVALNMPIVAADCSVCGSTYHVKLNMKTKSRFCSGKCKAKHRRDSGVDNEQRKCLGCKHPFIVNKYSKQKFCTRTCRYI